MRRKAPSMCAATIALMVLISSAYAQEEEGEEASRRTPTVPPTHYTYSSTANPLEMLGDIKAANEELLKKQRACLATLGELLEKAKANRAAAASSTRK